MRIEGWKGDFRPINLNFTLETEDEINTMYVLFNYTTLVNFIDAYMGAGTASKVRDAIRTLYGKTPPYDKIHTDLRVRLKGV